MAMARLVVEDCERFDVQRELFRSRRLRFNTVTEGTWQGFRWRILLSETGSHIAMGGRRWELVSQLSSSSISVARRYLLGHDGRRTTCLLLT
jgi:hypothetical protein